MTLDTIEKTRKELVHQKMGFNQMRNSIYWLQRYMRRHNLSDEDIQIRLERMGKNIGGTFVKEIEDISPDLENLIKDLYLLTVNSKVKVTQSGNMYHVKDSNSALSKYQYDDIHVSGDVIIVSAVSVMLERLGYPVEESQVEQCRSLGDKNSLHRYIINERRTVE